MRAISSLSLHVTLDLGMCRAGAGRGVQAVECGHRGLILAGDRPKPVGKNRKPEFAGTSY